jgi:predicted RNA binding protein YcfA (HicA-like mRNA interferase family)
MPELRELNYQKIISRLKKLGFRFYRQGKGSHELWVRDDDGKVIPIPHHRGKKYAKEL